MLSKNSSEDYRQSLMNKQLKLYVMGQWGILTVKKSLLEICCFLE